MEFNEYFSKNDLEHIVQTNYYNYSYHITITFNNRTNIDNYIKNFKDNFKNIKYEFYSWKCFTNRAFKKKSNSHKRKKHIHMIFYSNFVVDFEKNFNNTIQHYETFIKKIDYVEGLLEYIHDGHHIINDKYYEKNLIKENKDKRNLKDILKNLRTYT